ncbi:sugar 3,4-ketoisomerase [Pontibacter silvestris]|uniref:Sugar 3,4-ketoisomerase n=1 Tax=Pontibacter silvestris TaxID=2305183 RepID=A0ABW4WZT9_9BACT|nr:FdtA/QdtA family cupin domain-containing protein [Pontibacter silvestris]MCC9135641.1 FdtA/QdtA family cupin domain-containing protein [Pontibacter silvestris]
MPASPLLIHFDSIGSPTEGFITTTQYADKIPFAIKRVFWVHGTPPGVVRGNHANKATEEVLVAVHGTVSVKTDTGKEQLEFELKDEKTGLYIPAMCWTELTLAPGTIALCLTSTEFDEKDYIRDYSKFRKFADHVVL